MKTLLYRGQPCFETGLGAIQWEDGGFTYDSPHRLAAHLLLEWGGHVAAAAAIARMIEEAAGAWREDSTDFKEEVKRYGETMQAMAEFELNE